MQRSRIVRVVAGLFVVSLLAAACGDNKGSSGSNATTTAAPGGTAAASTTVAKTPVKGGVVTFGQFSREGGLDPIKLAGGGTVGGIEAAAIFDVLLRYIPDKGTYEGQLAESIAPNADFTEWTLKLRPNLKFADGTPSNTSSLAR
jgi:peptide/nickel transport system substrate-binding protein